MGEHTTWADWRSRAERVTSGGLEVAAYELGTRNGPWLTYLHGFPSSSLDVAPVLDALDGVAGTRSGDAGGWRVLAVDLPGYGAADKPRHHRYTLQAATDAAVDAWVAKGVRSTVLVVHDYSVSIAQELLARRAEGSLAVALEAVVLSNGGLFPDLHRPSAGQLMLADPEHGAEVAAAVDEPLFTQGIEVTWGQRVPFDTAAVHEMYESLAEGDGVPLMHDLLDYLQERRAHEDRWRRALEQTDVPLAFVWGDLDPISGAHMIERVEQLRPDAVIRRLADVGHWPPLEAPDELAVVIHERNWSGRSPG